ncbi:hypothetical protein [uncultured Roseibium sp.]|uniref:hypothetical protein n=1 Tax=uncultured Roseibium sp. TaxID=1936171 RepID=UPI002591D7B8|nr:hypothetical protein [uncultured Roseibium sp.]
MDTKVLDIAVQKGIIKTSQRDAIAALIPQNAADETGFKLDFTTILWVGGAGIVIMGLVALSMEAAEISEALLATLFAIYAVVFLGLSLILERREKSKLLCAILATGFALCLTLAYITLQTGSDDYKYFFDYSNEYQVPEENVIPLYQQDLLTWILGSAVAPSLILLASGLFVLQRFAFLPAWSLVILAIIALTQEIAVRAFYDPHGLQVISQWHLISFGLLIYLAGWWMDLKAPVNHGFWLNKLGMLPLSAGLGILFSEGSDPVKWIFLATCLLAIALSVFLRRPSGIGFGALGILTVIIWRFDVHEDDLTLALVLTAIGFATVAAGYYLQKHMDPLASRIPEPLLRFRPEQRDDPVTFGY